MMLAAARFAPPPLTLRPPAPVEPFARRRSGAGKGALIGGGVGLGIGLGVSLSFVSNSDRANPSIGEYIPLMAITTGVGAILGAAIGSRTDLPPPQPR